MRPRGTVRVNNKEEIGRRFRQFRWMINKSQWQLAEEIDIFQSIISNIESGKTFPRIVYLQFLNENYGLNINWLVTGKGDIRI